MKLRPSTREWLRLGGRCSVCNDGSPATPGKDGSTPPLKSSSRHKGPPWTNGTTVLGAKAEDVMTTTITEYIRTVTLEPVTLSEIVDDHHSDPVTSATTSTTTATPSSPLPPFPTDTNEPAQSQTSSLAASLTTVSSVLPSPSPTQTPAYEAPLPPAPPSASNPLQIPTSTETEPQDSPGIEHQNSSPSSSEPPQPAAPSGLPPLPDIEISKPDSTITSALTSESSMPLVTPVGGHTTSSSSTSQSPAAASTPIDITMTLTLTTAASATPYSKTWLLDCSAIPVDSRCPQYSTWTTPAWMAMATATEPVGCDIAWVTDRTDCPTTSSSTTMASAPITAAVPTSSFTCIGNSETCYCISGSCTMKSTFEIRTLSGVLVPPKSTSTSTSTATSTIDSPAELNTTLPTTTPASPRHPVPVLPIALGITTPIALVVLFLVICYTWRHLHPPSYNIYAQYCPFHHSFRAFTAVNARWKETREKNRDVRNLEKSVAAAEMLRRYELERARRRVEAENYQEEGLGMGMTMKMTGKESARANGNGNGQAGEGGRRTPRPTGWHHGNDKGKGREKYGAGAGVEKKPSWEKAWRRLGSAEYERRGTPLDTKTHGSTPMNKHREDEDEDADAITPASPASPGTTIVGSERRGSDRSGEHRGWI